MIKDSSVKSVLSRSLRRRKQHFSVYVGSDCATLVLCVRRTREREREREEKKGGAKSGFCADLARNLL